MEIVVIINFNGFLIPPHSLTSFKIQKYCKDEPRFNDVYSRDNFPRIKDGAYIINLHEYSDIGTHWIALSVQNNNNNDNNNNNNDNNNNVIYSDSFGVEHIPKEIKTFINRPLSSASHNKNIANIFRIQAYDSIMCGYFCIGFIDFMLKRKTLTEYTNLF